MQVLIQLFSLMHMSNTLSSITLSLFIASFCQSYGGEINIQISKSGAGGSNNLDLNNPDLVIGCVEVGDGPDKTSFPYQYQIIGINSKKVMVKINIKNRGEETALLDFIISLEEIPIRIEFLNGSEVMIRNVK